MLLHICCITWKKNTQSLLAYFTHTQTTSTYLYWFKALFSRTFFLNQPSRDINSFKHCYSFLFTFLQVKTIQRLVARLYPKKITVLLCFFKSPLFAYDLIHNRQMTVVMSRFCLIGGPSECFFKGKETPNWWASPPRKSPRPTWRLELISFEILLINPKKFNYRNEVLR